MKFPTAKTCYSSFDGGIRIESSCVKPDRYSFWDSHSSDGFRISRGAGMSYAPASFSKTALTIEHCRFNRITSFSADEKTLEVESGITLGEIESFLTPKGFFLAIQPGHPAISVGGCVAADVHGKNQFTDGTFISQVRSLRLFHPAHGVVELSPEREPDIFRLTCGGYGLTGSILSAKLALKQIQAPCLRMRLEPIHDIMHLPEILNEAASQAELIYTWHDFTAMGSRFGRGFLSTGRFAPAEVQRSTALRHHRNYIDSSNRDNWRLSFFNSLTTPVFNKIYYEMCSRIKSEWTVPLYDFLFPVHDKEMYFKLFGTSGFIEYQALIPTAKFGVYIEAVKRRLSEHDIHVTLASGKLFRGTQDLLRFSGTGVCMALNFPRTQAGLDFATFLDELMLRLGAMPNIIKDSRLPAAVVEKVYGEHALFKERLHRFDPERLFRSELSERLKL